MIGRTKRSRPSSRASRSGLSHRSWFCVRRNSQTAETKAAQRLARHGAADAFDNDIDATAGRYPANAIGETFPGGVNYIFEAKLACPSGFRRAAARRDDLAGALRP